MVAPGRWAVPGADSERTPSGNVGVIVRVRRLSAAR